MYDNYVLEIKDDMVFIVVMYFLDSASTSLRELHDCTRHADRQ